MGSATANLRQFVLVAALALLAIGFSAPSGHAQGGGDTIIVGHEASVPNLDNAQALGIHSVRVYRLIIEPLVSTKATSTELIPHLAKSWSFSDDGMEWTFKLRENVKFHDGEPLTAEAVKYSFERFMDKNHPEYKCGKWSFAPGYARGVKRVEVVDRLTGKLVFKAPHAAFVNTYLSQPVLGVISPKAFKKSCKDFGNNPVGTGPYKLESWERGVKLTMVRNEDYWGTKPKNKRIIWRPISEDTTRVAELLAGGVDVILPVFPDSISQIKANANTKILEGPGLTIWFVMMNHDKKPFNNKKVRQALNYAVNKQAIVRDVQEGTGIVATQAVHPTSWGYNPKARSYPYNPEKAKKLLAEAGYPNGFNATLWLPESGSGMQQPKEMAQVIQANLKAIGVNLKLEVFEWGTFLTKVIRKNERDFEMAAISWFLKTTDPDIALHPLYFSKNVPFLNYGKYKNLEVDKLLSQGREEYDQGKRKKIYAKALELINEDAPVILIDHQKEILGLRKNVRGVTMNPNGYYLGVETGYKDK